MFSQHLTRASVRTSGRHLPLYPGGTKAVNFPQSLQSWTTYSIRDNIQSFTNAFRDYYLHYIVYTI